MLANRARPRASGAAVMSFALAAALVTAAACVLQTHLVQSSFITLHFVAFTAKRLLIPFGLCLQRARHVSPWGRCQRQRGFSLRSTTPDSLPHITTNSTRIQHKVYSTAFRFIPSSFTRQVCSPPAAIVVLAGPVFTISSE
jgi:hypothetical protein